MLINLQYNQVKLDNLSNIKVKYCYNMEVKKKNCFKMKKEDIVNQVTLYEYCYQKAKENVIKTWTLNDEEIEELDSNEPIVFKDFIKMHDKIKLDEELENINKFYLKTEKEIKKCLDKYRSHTGVFTKRLEYLITRRII